MVLSGNLYKKHVIYTASSHLLSWGLYCRFGLRCHKLIALQDRIEEITIRVVSRKLTLIMSVVRPNKEGGGSELRLEFDNTGLLKLSFSTPYCRVYLVID